MVVIVVVTGLLVLLAWATMVVASATCKLTGCQRMFQSFLVGGFTFHVGSILQPVCEGVDASVRRGSRIDEMSTLLRSALCILNAVLIDSNRF
jgi:hypothetical protein